MEKKGWDIIYDEDYDGFRRGFFVVSTPRSTPDEILAGPFDYVKEAEHAGQQMEAKNQ